MEHTREGFSSEEGKDTEHSTLEFGKVKIHARLNTKRVKRQYNFQSGTEKKKVE